MFQHDVRRLHELGAALYPVPQGPSHSRMGVPANHWAGAEYVVDILVSVYVPDATAAASGKDRADLVRELTTIEHPPGDELLEVVQQLFPRPASYGVPDHGHLPKKRRSVVTPGVMTALNGPARKVAASVAQPPLTQKRGWRGC